VLGCVDAVDGGPYHMSGLQPIVSRFLVSMMDQAWATVISLLDQTWAVTGVLDWATKQLSIIFPFSQLLLRPLFGSISEKCFYLKNRTLTKRIKFEAVFLENFAFPSTIFTSF